jgi:molecular chaperone HtpG
MKNPSECTDKEYLEFYQKLYPQEPDPMFWIHLNVDYPFRLKGILYFPKHFHAVQEKNLPIKLFCNRVFVSDDCREILPDYLMMLCGAIDSADIPLNVSRSYLQVDQNVKQVGSHISKKVADRINHLLKTDRDQYLTYWNELGLFLKYGLLRDDKFYERTKDALIWKNSSNEWTTIQDYLDRAKEKKVYYCTEDCSTILQKAFINRGLELIYTGSNPINSPVLTKLEEKFSPVQFQRIDSELENALLDESREKTVLDQDGKTQAGRIRNLFQSNLSADLVEVEAKSLSSDALPGLLLIDERTRRFREYLGLTEQNMKSSAFGKSKFVVNTNNKLVQKAWKLADHQPELAKLLITQLYDLARVAQKEIEPKELDGILVRNQELLEQLAERLPT